MLDTIQLVIAQLAQTDVQIALIVGSVLGIVIGAIPGIGPGVGIVLLLPVTYTMEPLAGITLLMGFNAAGWYGGAIPAITINTPGTGVNVLTTYDGHPMAKGSEPQRALSLAYASGLFGGIFAVVVLSVAAWPLAALSKYLTSIDLGMAPLLAMVLVFVARCAPGQRVQFIRHAGRRAVRIDGRTPNCLRFAPLHLRHHLDDGRRAADLDDSRALRSQPGIHSDLLEPGHRQVGHGGHQEAARRLP